MKIDAYDSGFKDVVKVVAEVLSEMKLGCTYIHARPTHGCRLLLSTRDDAGPVITAVTNPLVQF